MDWINSDKFYKSGKTPKYEVGQKATLLGYLYYGWNMALMRKESQPCEIISVSKKKSGLFFKEFTYTVKVEDEEYTNIYESQLGKSKEE